MEEMELVLSNPSEGEMLKKIEWNRNEIANAVQYVTSMYENMTYDEEHVALAMKDRAKLNKLKTAIDKRRIEIKKELLAPYDIFEKEVKEVTGMIDKPIACIDSQIKTYENKQKQAKRDALEEHFNSITEDLNGALEFRRVFDEKYLNKSVSLSSAKADIEQKVSKFKSDIVIIGNIEEKYRSAAMANYSRTLDLSSAMSEVYAIQETEKKVAELQKKKEQEMAKAEPKEETPKPVVEETPAEEIKPSETANNEPTEASNEAVYDPFTKKEPEKKYRASFTVVGTREQILALKQYMIDNNIQFGKVEK